jgi:hypothetical protein
MLSAANLFQLFQEYRESVNDDILSAHTSSLSSSNRGLKPIYHGSIYEFRRSSFVKELSAYDPSAMLSHVYPYYRQHVGYRGSTKHFAVSLTHNRLKDPAPTGESTDVALN